MGSPSRYKFSALACAAEVVLGGRIARPPEWLLTIAFGSWRSTLWAAIPSVLKAVNMEDALEALPEGVRRAAAEYGGNIRDRLIRGEQIIKLWTGIIDRKINSDTLIDLPKKYRCRDESGLDNANVAAAALFLISMCELCDVTYYDSDQNEDSIKLYRRLASLCSSMKNLRFLGGVDEYLGDLHPRNSPETQEALEKASCFFGKLAEALEKADRGVRWDHRSDHRSKLGRAASKHLGALLDTDSDRAIKARLSAFIEAADKVYASPRLTRPLADIASAVLAMPIDKKLIENCRRSLDRHRGPKSTRRC